MIDILSDNIEYCFHLELELSLLVVRIIRLQRGTYREMISTKTYFSIKLETQPNPS